MTIDWHRYWWQPGFALAFFAVGMSYWLIPYNKINLPSALIGSVALWLSRKGRDDEQAG
jgi:hypothetical protein